MPVISTLDRLKLAPNPLHDLARDATRFLDAQFQIARQIAAAAPPAADPPSIRLRPQRAGEELAWSEAQARFAVPEGLEVEHPVEMVEVFAGRAEKALENGEEPELLPAAEAERIPKELRAALQCVLHFHLVGSAAPTSSPTTKSTLGPVTLVVYPALPTPPTPSSILFPPSPSATTPTPDFLALSSGDHLATLIDTFFAPQRVEVHRVSGAEAGAARDWFRAQARAAQAGQGKVAPRQEGVGQGEGKDRHRPRRGGRDQEGGVGEGGVKGGGRGQGQGQVRLRGSGEAKPSAGGGSSGGGGNGRRGHGTNDRGSTPAGPQRTNSNSRPATGTLFVP